MSSQVELARRWFDEVWNGRRAEAIAELVAPASECHTAAGILRGPEAFRTAVFEPFVSAFPDLHVAVAGVVEQGDEVVVRWTATGTHTGPGLGLPASGRPINVRGMTWIRFADGKFVEGWDCWNVREMIESLK
jgi:steroid delta-isomerase-like uncharacterized protein